MIRRFCGLVIVLLCFSASLFAGITTYTFTSASWTSRQGTVAMDGTTDGWVCDKAGAAYETSSNPNFQNGVKVTAAYSGAGATSVQAFDKVRQLTFSYATTTKGTGAIRVQVGDAAPIDSVVSIGQANHDLTITLPAEQSGKIKIAVLCTKNSIWLNAVSIRSASGASPEFTQSTFQLVTDIHALQDSDQVIFGVADGTTKSIMGYYDEYISQNNIHAIAGSYNTARTQVNANDNAIYTLRKTLGEDDTDTVYVFQDELRYEEAYLVASGGRTKNKLTLWTDVVSPSYGNFGFWRMTISPDGAAVIENAGTSTRKYLQYNQADALFGCYADPASQTKVCLFREVPALGTDEPAISAALVNFGDVVLTNGVASGSRVVEINAIRLTADMSLRLRNGSVFSLSANTVDRDGGSVTLTYALSAAGRYVDTLVITSGSLTKEVSVLLHAVAPLSIAEAAQSADFEHVYLNPVVVTKKYDTYVFIRDDTGSMLIFDATNPATGKPYAQGLVQGQVLTDVQGRYSNYYGVPEIRPTAAWTASFNPIAVEPQEAVQIDSSKVCQYVRVKQLLIDATGKVQINGIPTDIDAVDAFNTGLIRGVETTTDAIVMISWNVIQLWVVKQTPTSGTALPSVLAEPANLPELILQQGHIYLRQNDILYDLTGKAIR